MLPTPSRLLSQERPQPPIWRCNINGLYAQTPYEFVVQALTERGDGARSEPTPLKFTLPAQVRLPRCSPSALLCPTPLVVLRASRPVPVRGPDLAP